MAEYNIWDYFDEIADKYQTDEQLLTEPERALLVWNSLVALTGTDIIIIGKLDYVTRVLGNMIRSDLKLGYGDYVTALETAKLDIEDLMASERETDYDRQTRKVIRKRLLELFRDMLPYFREVTKNYVPEF